MSPVSFATPEDAEVAFYAAFERGDVEAMMTVLAGREAVKQSWQTIFARSPGIKFTIAPQLQAIDSRLALHVVHEHIQLSGEERRRHTVIATNAYRFTATGWRMVLHHASPATATENLQAATLH
jgi:ketosteroid isomerase-like protein